MSWHRTFDILAAGRYGIKRTGNYTVRVYLPEWDQWAQGGTAVTFGIEAGMQGPDGEAEGEDRLRPRASSRGRGWGTA